MKKKYMLIYQNNRPHGIRDNGGFILFFAKVQKWQGQEERYRNEIEDQFKIADFILEKLNDNANP